MKVSELIKQAEELLDKALSEPLGINTCLDEAEFDFYLFARNHMQELIDKLKSFWGSMDYDYLKIIKALGRALWSQALCLSDEDRRGKWRRMSNPEPGDLVMELTTSHQKRGRGKKAPVQGIGHYLGGRPKETLTIKTLNGQFATWSNCQFITLIERDKDLEWVSQARGELQIVEKRGRKKQEEE